MQFSCRAPSSFTVRPVEAANSAAGGTGRSHARGHRGGKRAALSIIRPAPVSAIADRLTDVFQHQFPFEATKPSEQRLFGGDCGGDRLALQLPGFFSEVNKLRALVQGVRPALDQSVALHARERVGHRRLFDIDALKELSLGQSILAPEFEEDRKLPGRKTESRHP